MPSHCVPKEYAGAKLLQYVVRVFSVSISKAHKLIRKGNVRINGRRAKPFTVLQEADIVHFPAHCIPAWNNDDVKAHGCCDDANMALNHPSNTHRLPPAVLNLLQGAVIYEDANLLVLNKPAGIPVHNGSRHTSSITSYIHTLYNTTIFPPTLIHRLDKETTGILLFAKNYATLQQFHQYWRGHQVEKYYLAWVRGLWEKTETHHISNMLLRIEEGVTITANAGASVSITVKCLQKTRSASLLIVHLHTGKTHQIRAQLAHLGFPILGESKYATNPKKLPLFLHAVALRVAKQHSYSVAPTHWRGALCPRAKLAYTPEECHNLLYTG